MSRRLPRPEDGKRVRLELADGELHAVELAAAACRMSVASYLRALVVLATAKADMNAAIIAQADRIAAGAPADRARPGRPKKGKGKP